MATDKVDKKNQQQAKPVGSPAADSADNDVSAAKIAARKAVATKTKSGNQHIKIERDARLAAFKKAQKGE